MNKNYNIIDPDGNVVTTMTDCENRDKAFDKFQKSIKKDVKCSNIKFNEAGYTIVER